MAGFRDDEGRSFADDPVAHSLAFALGRQAERAVGELRALLEFRSEAAMVGAAMEYARASLRADALRDALAAHTGIAPQKPWQVGPISDFVQDVIQRAGGGGS